MLGVNEILKTYLEHDLYDPYRQHGYFFFRFPLIPMGWRKAIFFFKQVLKLFRERQWTIL